jgi:S-adenosylmethionine decarboxylase
MEEPTNFGVHLTIDGYKGDREKLNNFELIYNLLNQLPGEISMQKLMPPYVIIAPPVTQKDQGGISGFIIIAESHISIHTFPEKGFISIDVYTCKNEMDSDKIVNYFKDVFNLKEIEVNIIKRGTKFFQ